MAGERGRHMGRVSGVMALSAFGLALAGCSSGSVNGLFPGMASSNPAKATIQLQSEPAGAQATTSLGSSCQTPCSLELAANSDLSVTFSLDGYQPQTIPVKPVPGGPIEPGTYSTVALTPNPVLAQLEKVAPPAKTKPKQHKHVAAAKPKPPAAQSTQPETAPPPPSPPAQ